MGIIKDILTLRMIRDVIGFYKKRQEEKEEKELFLTKEQKKKYKWQYIKTTTATIALIFVLVMAIGQSIIQLFITKNMIFLALVIVFFTKLTEITKEMSHELDLIPERIEKREKKNKKQLDKIEQIQKERGTPQTIIVDLQENQQESEREQEEE